MRTALEALTREACHALGGEDMRIIDRYPFRVGRECRDPGARRPTATERRGGAAPNNECYLLDTGAHLQIAREHFQIERDETGRFYLLDRGSTTGTLVEGHAIGHHAATTWVDLEPGMTVHVGTRISPYRFRFIAL